MIAWLWVIASSVIAYLTKLAGYLVPREILERPAVVRVAEAMTVGLLAALVVVQTFSADGGVAADARILALVVAVVALLLRAPFLVVVLLGAGVVALGRYLGLN